MNTNFFINPNDQSIYQQYLQMQNNVDYYGKLEQELQSLTDNDINGLSVFRPYIEANNALSMLVQAELLNLIRTKINSNPDVINNVINAVRLYKQEKSKEQSDFQDYIKNYSDLSYKEYLQLKNDKK